MTRITIAVAAIVLASTTPILAQTSTQELKRMSLEDLLNIPVTIASRVPEPVTTIPAAVFVITQEDIRRSGATSLAEVLRLAPGLQVARISGGTWAVGIRGFADRLARSILVLIDGRAVYSPLFAGTYWEAQGTLLDDVDHIEIIRGPGGTLWGANAVDGVVNIITKSAVETQGLLVTGAGGNEQLGLGAIRYGGTAGSVTYRGYFRAIDFDHEFHANANNFDGWRSGQGGFRADWNLGRARDFTIQGDAYGGRLGEQTTVVSYTSPFSVATNQNAAISGGNVLARYSRRTASDSDLQLQAYYDRTNRDEIPVGEDRDTGDVDFQHTLRRWQRHLVTWGAGYRITSGRINAVAPTAFTPQTRTDNLFTAFGQDELGLPANRWRLTFGAKLEHNDYSGVEFQPSARISWTPRPAQTFWAALTRAVRTPSRVETDYTTTSLVSATPAPTFVRLVPDPAFVPESLIAYEFGYRARPIDALYLTATAFYNDLEHTLSTELLTPFVETAPPPSRVIVPVDFGNGLHGNSLGAEFHGDFHVKPWWRLVGNYSYLDVNISRNPGSRDVSQEHHYEGAIPHHQVQAGTSFDVSRWSFDWLIRSISALPALSVPAYTTSDFRVARQIGSQLEIAIVGQDLFHDHHLEWTSGPDTTAEVKRSLYARITWRR